MTQRKLIPFATLAIALCFGVSTLSAQKVYWIDSGNLEILRADLDGSNAEVVLAAEVLQPRGVALDVASGKVYWADNRLGQIMRSSLNGTDLEVVVESNNSEGLALDLAGGKMYWTTLNTVFRADLEGSEVEELVTVSFPENILSGIALDVAAGKMYWTNRGADKIQRANLDGSTVEDLLTEPGISGGIALDVAVVFYY